MKYLLRKSFEGEISDEILWRPKKTFQVGCHTDLLKQEKDKIKEYFEKILLITHNPMVNQWADSVVKIKKEDNISKDYQ